MPEKNEVEKLLESLNPDERAILPYLEENKLEKIKEKTRLEETKILRAVQFLQNKKILISKSEKTSEIDLDNNGIVYLKHGLPERRLLNLLADKPNINLNEAKSMTRLSDDEFKVSLGVLKRKAMINLSRETIILTASKIEIAKKSLEELFLEILPIKQEKLHPEQKLAFENLKKRKNIIKLNQKTEIKIELTQIGKELLKQNLEKYKDMIETLTPEILKSESYKGKKFRRYDIKINVPEIISGKKHFVNQAVEYARRIWTELGFQEMTGNLTQTGFWNFDALFTAQDHPVREMHDTFYIKDIKGKLPQKDIIKSVKESHEKGISGSKGWQYSWNEEEPKKVLLRTHTTCLSAQTLGKLRNLKNKKGKFFAIGKVFRNETIDWSHEFEFNQTEGIVVDKNANFTHLLGYLKEFFNKMGFEKIRFTPAYFPYTEPSVEINWFHPEKKVWLELGGAGIFRPEVTIPLLGEYVPVLAWGPGFDRIIMDYYQIKDLREMYENNITKLRDKKIWIK